MSIHIHIHNAVRVKDSPDNLQVLENNLRTAKSKLDALQGKKKELERQGKETSSLKFEIDMQNSIIRESKNGIEKIKSGNGPKEISESEIRNKYGAAFLERIKKDGYGKTPDKRLVHVSGGRITISAL